ncbi:MAG: alpha-xenorhabdolysin family binary toxin subunit A [Acidobacteriaceae bacterium]
MSTLEPPIQQLTRQNQNGPDQPPLFALFTNDWLTLQAYIVQALQLPLTTADFTAKYGTFADQQQITNVVNAMQSVQALSAQFGDPATLVAQLAQDPAILEGTTPPAEIYPHIVWLANQVYNAAQTFTGTLSSFEQLLNPSNCGSQAQCAAILKEVLTGVGGLQSTAQTAQGQTNDLIQKLAQFNQSMVAPNQQLQAYTTESSQFYTDAQAAEGQDASDVAIFQTDANAAYKEWENYTIAATTTSVGITVLSCGLLWPVGAALGGGLGYAAGKARESYNNYCGERNQATADEQKKAQLVTDLSGFNSQIQNVSGASASFLSTLQQVEGAWTTIGQNLSYIVNNYTDAQLSSYSWIVQALNLNQATQDWQAIGAAAQSYTTNSLVTFTFQQFGTPLPTATAAHAPALRSRA